MNEKDIIQILQKEIKIPDVVQDKANAAIAAIQEEVSQSQGNDKSGKGSFLNKTKTTTTKVVPAAPGTYHSNSRKIPRKKMWIALVAAILILGTVSVGASAYMKWSRSLEQGLRVTKEQKPVLEENHTAVAVNKSVTDNGITITAQQTIVDSYYAYLSFKVEGYEVEEGIQPDFEFITITVDGEEPSWSGSFYNGWVTGDNGMAVMDDGSAIPVNEDGSYMENYTMEDGSLDYQCVLSGHDREGFFIGKEIHVEFQNMGTVYKAEYTPDIEGSWTLDWVLEGCEDIRKYDLSVPLGDTGATVVQAEISPISLKTAAQFPRQEISEAAVDGTTGEEFEHTTYAEPPALSGVRMKDGTLYPYLYAGPGTMGYESEDSDLYCETFAIDRVLDIDQVESLLFQKTAPEIGENVTEENFYIVPLEQ